MIWPSRSASKRRVSTITSQAKPTWPRRWRSATGRMLQRILKSLLQNSAKPLDALRRYPETFRWALENENRICLCSFMSAQFDDLPDSVKTEVQAFADVNIAWLKKTLVAAKLVAPRDAEKRARAIYSGIVGAQLMARSRADISLYDSLIESYRTTGLLPA